MASLCSLSTVWHTRHTPAAPRGESALFSYNRVLVGSCHGDLSTAQSVQTPPRSCRDHASSIIRWKIPTNRRDNGSGVCHGSTRQRTPNAFSPRTVPLPNTSDREASGLLPLSTAKRPTGSRSGRRLQARTGVPARWTCSRRQDPAQRACQQCFLLTHPVRVASSRRSLRGQWLYHPD